MKFLTDTLSFVLLKFDGGTYYNRQKIDVAISDQYY